MDALREFATVFGVADVFGKGFWSVVLTFVVAMGFTWLFIPRLRQFALEVGWADQPNERRLNHVPLPNAGGLAIFAGFILSIVAAWLVRPIMVDLVSIQVLAILLGAALLVLVGFIDDQYGLSPMFRIATQLLATSLLMANGLTVDYNSIPFLPAFPENWAPVVNTIFTMLWVVGLTNALNLLDGVDGVVGGVAFVGSVMLLATAAQFPDRAAAVILLAGLSGAALGYLRHNFNPSLIIMGDAGSTLFGFTLAAVSMLGTLKLSAGASFLVPLMILALPVVDTTQVVIGRFRRGIKNPLAHPDKTHIHHRLLGRTANARSTAVILWGVAVVCGVVGMLLQGIAPSVIGVTVFLTVAALWFPAARRIRAQLTESNAEQKPSSTEQNTPEQNSK